MPQTRLPTRGKESWIGSLLFMEMAFQANGRLLLIQRSKALVEILHKKKKVVLHGLEKTIVAERFSHIIVSYWNEDGSFVENLMLEEYEAQVWQHEVNHLDGKKEKILVNQIERRPRKPGRNEPCLCGSGKKFKKCCGKQT